MTDPLYCHRCPKHTNKKKKEHREEERRTGCIGRKFRVCFIISGELAAYHGIQRFEFRNGTRDKSAAKIDTQVQFPLSLSMLPYTNRARSADAKEQYELSRSCTYDLMSVVVHVGEIDTGHYISYCRVGDQVSHFHYWRAVPCI